MAVPPTVTSFRSERLGAPCVNEAIADHRVLWRRRLTVAADECLVRSQALGGRRLAIRHASRSRDRPLFEPENAGELGPVLVQAEGSVTGARRGTASERGACRPLPSDGIATGSVRLTPIQESIAAPARRTDQTVPGRSHRGTPWDPALSA